MRDLIIFLTCLWNLCRAAITFSFNALLGRIPSDEHNTLWEGDWNQFNAKSLMKHTIEKGYKIDSYELGKLKKKKKNSSFFFLLLVYKSERVLA